MKELKTTYVESIVAQSPQFLLGLRTVPGDLIHATWAGIGRAARHRVTAVSARQSPCLDFDDIANFEPADILWAEASPASAVDAARPIQLTVNGLQTAAGVGNVIAQGFQQQASQGRGEWSELSAAGAAGAAGAAAGLQAFAGLGNVIAQNIQNSQFQNAPRAKGSAQPRTSGPRMNLRGDKTWQGPAPGLFDVLDRRR